MGALAVAARPGAAGLLHLGVASQPIYGDEIYQYRHPWRGDE
ncbi:hypothetical protein PA07A_1223 [Cutibacterium acnes P07A]|nr:hypothetical protein [Cutibacterium acnes P07A]